MQNRYIIAYYDVQNECFLISNTVIHLMRMTNLPHEVR